MSSFVGGADIVVGPGGVTTAGGADGESGMTTYHLLFYSVNSVLRIGRFGLVKWKRGWTDNLGNTFFH